MNDVTDFEINEENNTNPFVTVFMPVFNGEKYVRQSIESVLNQTYKNFELLIINDGSTDNCVNIIKSLNDKRIRYIENKSNKQLIHTRNRGFLESKSEYIFLQDCDDISLPNRIEVLINAIKDNDDIGVVGSAYNVMTEKGKILYKNQMPIDKDYVFWSSFFFSPVANPSCLIRKSVALKVGLYSDSMFNVAADYDLNSRVQFISNIKNIKDVTVNYRVHNGCISKTKHELVENNSYIISHFIITKFLEKNIDFNIVKSLRTLKFESVESAESAINLIIELFNKFVEKRNPSKKVLKQVKTDIARRIFIIYLYNYFSPKLIKYINISLTYDMLGLFKTMLFIVNRIYKKSLNILFIH